MMRHERGNDAELLRYLSALRNCVEQSGQAGSTNGSEEVKESDRIFRAIFENAADGILLVDVESRRFYMGNRVVCQMLGYGQQELQTLEIGDIHPEKNLPYVTEQFEKQVREELTLARNIPVKRKDGSVFYADINAFPIPFGPKTYLMGIFRDITERRSAEEAIRRSEEQFRGIFENTAVGMYRTTPDGRILMANPALVRMLGYSSFEELALRNLEAEGYEPQYPRSVFKERIEETGEIRGFESAWVREDGMILTIIENARAVRDGHGNTLYYEGTAEDITEHKKAENALRQSEQKWRSLMENAPDVILMADLDGTILSANRVVFPLTRETIVGTSLYDYIPSEHQRTMRNAIEHVVRTGKSYRYELAGTGPGGQMAWYQSHVGPVKRDDQVIGVTIIARDATEQKAMEDELRQFKTVADRAGYGIGMIDLDSHITYMNDTFAHMHGYQVAEMLGKHISIFHTERQMENVNRLNQQLLETGSYVAEDVWQLRRDGTEFCVSMNGTLVRDESGEPQFLACTAVDITHRKKIEAALAESEEKYRTLVESSGDAIFIIDEHGIFLFANRKGAEVTGFQPEELVGKTMWDFFPKEVADRRIDAVLKVIETKQDMSIVRQTELRGQLFWYHTKLLPIGDGHGGIVVMAVSRDVGDIKQAEERIRILSSAVEQSMDGIAIGDHERKLRYVNPAYARMHGYASEEMEGMIIMDVHNRKSEEEYKEIVHLIDAHGSWMGEVEHVRKDGTVFPCFLSATCITDDYGKIAGRLVVCRDITESRKREKEIAIYREKMAHAEQLVSLGTLSATIVHQLTQPLTVIRLSLDNVVDELERTSCSNTVLRRLRDSVAQVSNITAIINRFRNFARQSSDTDFGQVNVYAVAVRVARLLTESARQARVKLHVEDLSKLPPVILHEREFEQILFALIENAIQAADGDNVRRIVISGHAKDEHIELCFADNCGGIAPENLDRIFEPFFTTKPRGQGTGLGLCIVRDAVARVGGRVRVESKFGKGSIFFVTLPVNED